MPRPIVRPRLDLGLQRHQHVRVEVHRPVVLDDIDLLRLRIGGPHLLIELHHLGNIEPRALPGHHPGGERIQGRRHPGGRIGGMAAHGQGLASALRFVAAGEAGLAVVGQFILIEDHAPPVRGPRLGEQLVNGSELVEVVGIGAVDVIARRLVMDADPLQQLAEARAGDRAEEVAGGGQFRQGPARARHATLPRVAPEQVEDAFPGHLRGFLLGRLGRRRLNGGGDRGRRGGGRARHRGPRGKKRACARVPVGW